MRAFGGGEKKQRKEKIAKKEELLIKSKALTQSVF